MLSAIGIQTTRQLRLAGVCSVRHLVVRHIPRSAIITFQKGFCETRPRPEAVNDIIIKPREPKPKAEEKAQLEKAAKKTKARQERELEKQERALKKKMKAQEERALAKKKVQKEKALEKKKAAKNKALEKKKAQQERAKALAKVLKEKNAQKNAKEKRSAEILKLKSIALLEEVPRRGAGTIMATYAKEHGIGDFKEISERLKGFTEAERENMRAKTAALNETAKVQYETFLLSKTPFEIWEANQARAKLNKLKIRTKPFKLIQDPRFPKRFKTSFLCYLTARKQTGDFEDRSNEKGYMLQIVKELAEEWRGLSDAERQPYVELANRDRDRYARECKALGIPTRAKENAE